MAGGGRPGYPSWPNGMCTRRWKTGGPRVLTEHACVLDVSHIAKGEPHRSGGRKPVYRALDDQDRK